MAALLPRQEPGEDLDTTRCFSSLGNAGGRKGTSFSGLWGTVARGSYAPKITMACQVGVPAALTWERDSKCSSGCRG